MPVVYSRNFASGTHRYLSLNGSDYLRTLSIGNNWTRIRIGMLCSMGTVSEQAWQIRSSCLTVGMCNSASSSFSTKAPRHAVGFSFSSAPSTANAGSLTYNAGTGGNSYFSSTGRTFHSWQNGVQSSSGVGSTAVYVPSSTTIGGALARRGLFILEMVKSAPYTGTMTQGYSSGNVAHMSLDLTSSDLYTALESTGYPVIQGTALTGYGVANGVGFNELSYGPLDTVCVHWNHYTVPFQLYELAVFRQG